ncbi:MAG: carotenoid biosynthesis protein [Chloroflexota bacterium]
MSLVIALLAAHLLALLFGLGGLLIILPNPSLWVGNPLAAPVFAFGMQYAGALHIVLGALAMIACGVFLLGWKRTLIFFAISTTFSVSMELLGTGTGWPFGAYEYTEGLGAKIGGRVPYTIPLSWFTMGLASYLLALGAVRHLGRRARTWHALALGVWLLTVWDLVLDPAMAHESLPMKFWTWHQTGPYFGMPIQNFIGWAGTGLLFMAVSHWLWRSVPALTPTDMRVPFIVYAANILFAVGLSLSVGLWEPCVLAGVLGVLPAALALWQRPRGARSTERSNEAPGWQESRA